MNRSGVSDALVAFRAAVEQLRSREVSFLVSIRQLCDLGYLLDLDTSDPDFVYIVAADSESHDLANDAVKAIASLEWLKQSEQGEERLEALYRRDFLAACERIVERLANAA